MKRCALLIQEVAGGEISSEIIDIYPKEIKPFEVELSIQKIVKQFSPDIESMEGAATFYVAKQENTPVIQIRSISNLVEKRNKMNWNTPLAIKNLNQWLIQFITEINNHS